MNMLDKADVSIRVFSCWSGCLILLSGCWPCRNCWAKKTYVLIHEGPRICVASRVVLVELMPVEIFHFSVVGLLLQCMLWGAVRDCLKLPVLPLPCRTMLLPMPKSMTELPRHCCGMACSEIQACCKPSCHLVLWEHQIGLPLWRSTN